MAATVLSNGQAAAQPPQRMLERAYAMYATRAYVHQYAAHGTVQGTQTALSCYVRHKLHNRR